MSLDGNVQDYTKVKAPQKVYDRDNPPTRMSEAIRMAVADLEAVEADPRYKVNMKTYHNPVGQTCYVCFAGAVMSATLNADPEDYLVHTAEWGAKWQAVLYFLNEVRLGEVRAAKRAWLTGEDQTLARRGTPADVTLYEDNPAAFKRDMLALADRLEAEGS